jgi:potassium efflux system protein
MPPLLRSLLRPVAGVAAALSLAAFAPPSAAQAPAAEPPVAAEASVAAPVLNAPVVGATAAAPAVAPQATAQAVAPEDDWIRPEDVADRADLLVRRFESRNTSDSARATVLQIDAAMTRLDQELAAGFEQAKVALTAPTSLLTIQDARRELAGSASSFPKWKEQLDDEARRVFEVLQEAELAHRRWSRTLARSETTAAGEAIVRRVQNTIALVEQARADLLAWRVRVLALNDRLLDRTNAVMATLEKLEAATVSESASVLIPDRAPIWNRDIAAQLAREVPQIPARMRQFARSTSEYIASDARPFALQIAIGLLLAFMLRHLPERSRVRLGGSATLPDSMRLLERPYAIASLLVLALSPSMHPTAPSRVMQILGVVALLPVARLLSLANRRSNVSLYIGLFAMLLLDRASTALASLPAVTLVLFLFQLAVAATVGLEYRRRLEAAKGSPFIISAINVALVGVVFSIFAEAGGWSSLASLVGRGFLVCATVALYVYAITLSLEALLAYALGSPALRTSRFVDRNQAMVQRWASIGLRVLGALYWFKMVVNALGLGDIMGEFLTSALTSGVSVGALSISLGGVLAFVLTIAVAMVTSRVVHEVLEDEVFPRTNLPRGIPNALLTLSTYVIWSLGFVLALAAAGVELSQLAILLGGLGVGIGLGLQDVVKNFAAGITLLLERRLHVGDAVQIPDQNVFGRIIAIGMRASVVRNWNGTEAILPNDDLVSGTVTNWTLSDEAHRIEVAVGVAYGTDPQTIIALLESVARADERFLKTPPPVAFFTGFGESSLDFVVRAWSDEPYETGSARTSELAVAVHAALRDAGVDIPFPQREVNITSVAPGVAEMLRSKDAR